MLMLDHGDWHRGECMVPTRIVLRTGNRGLKSTLPGDFVVHHECMLEDGTTSHYYGHYFDNVQDAYNDFIATKRKFESCTGHVHMETWQVIEWVMEQKEVENA